MLAGVMSILGNGASNVPVASAAVPPSDPPFNPQPADRHSNLPLQNGDHIWDREFVYYLTSTLGITNCESLVFVFGQCFGGGMIDELANAGFTCALSAQSAARYDQFSWGWWEDYYLRALAQTLALSPTQAISRAARTARLDDPVGPFANPRPVDEHGHPVREDPQYFGSGSMSRTVTISGAQSFHAVLFAGNPDRARHWNDLIRMYNLLTSTYGYTAGQIHVLYDNGVWPTGQDAKGIPYPPNPGIAIISATRYNLTTTLTGIGQVMNSHEQFFWWSSDHGGSGPIPTSTVPGGGAGNCTNTEGNCVITMSLTLTDSQLALVAADSSLDFVYRVNPMVGPPPFMTVCFNAWCASATFASTQPEHVILPIPPTELRSENQITFTVSGDLSALYGGQVSDAIVNLGSWTTQVANYRTFLPTTLKSP